jgi:transposase
VTGRWELNDEQWAVVEPVLRPLRRADNRGRPWHDTRAVLNGVLWVLGTGAQWREMPEKYPPYQTCHRRLQQWVRSGKLDEALKQLAPRAGTAKSGRGVRRCHLRERQKGGFAVGPTRRGKGTKIIAIAADNSLPLAVSVDSASPAECQLVEYVLAGSFLDHLPARLIGDKAYDSDPLDRRLHEEYGIEMIAPQPAQPEQ